MGRPALTTAHGKRCGQLVTRATNALKQRNVIVHLTWHAIPLHDGRHLGVGIRKGPDGQGLLGMLRSTEEMITLGIELHDTAAAITELQHAVAHRVESPVPRRLARDCVLAGLADRAFDRRRYDARPR